MNFNTFQFHPQVTSGISTAGYTNPTPIQVQAIPKVMQGCDVLGLAQTGTGKTAAYVLPILHRLLNGKRGRLRALVVAPTRELAEQIHQAIEELGTHTGLRSGTVYGGVGIGPQIQLLKRADIIVACPGRLLDHIKRQTINLSHLEVLVLDEADQMFDMGFLPDIRRILTHVPQSNRQTLLFSATMPPQIQRLSRDILKNQVKVQIAHEAPADTVSHALYPVSQHLKTPLLLEILGKTSTDAVLVFTRTKHRAKNLAAKLIKAGIFSTSLQGNLSQSQRRNAINGFKSGKYQVMVATDIAARGIDISSVSHVINYDMPSTPEIYIHRIGRTGRAERSGQAFTMITDDDSLMVKAIHKAIGKPVPQCTLENFNYHAPSPVAAPQRKRGSVKVSPSIKTKHKKKGRDSKGSFSWLSPRKSKNVQSRPRASA